MQMNNTSELFNNDTNKVVKSVDGTQISFPKTYTVKAKVYKKIEDPLMVQDIKTIIAYCNVNDLPNDIPLENTNPRDQKMNTKVVKSIIEELKNDSDGKQRFHLLNRGILISANSVTYNNKTNEMSFELTDIEKHGNVDGGHTYRAIIENRDKLENDQYVRLEIMAGIEDFFEDLAGARNTSNQVKDRSIAELENKFEEIKDIIREKDPKFFNRIAFKENEDKPIDIREILSIMTMFNIEEFGENNPPVKTYNSLMSGIKSYLKHYEDKANPYFKMLPIFLDFFELYNHYQENMSDYYKQATDNKGKFGALKGIKTSFDNSDSFGLHFNPDKQIKYGIPKGFIKPVIAAFAEFVEEDPATNKYRWKFDMTLADLKKTMDDLGPTFAITTIENTQRNGNNPDKLGKDKSFWKQTRGLAQNTLLKIEVELLKKNIQN